MLKAQLPQPSYATSKVCLAAWSTHGSAIAGSTQASSSASGPVAQYASSMAVEAGLHHDAPPPPYRGYSPAWMHWAKGGTASSTGPPRGGLGQTPVSAAEEAIAATARNPGAPPSPRLSPILRR